MQDVNLLSKGNRVVLTCAESRAEQIAKATQDTIRADHVALHQRGDGVQRIEQEMRPELGTEARELSLGESLLRCYELRTALPQAKQAQCPVNESEPETIEQTDLHKLIGN